MELCLQGCGDVFNSRELLEVLNTLLGIDNQRKVKSMSIDIDDTALKFRLQVKVNRKLRNRKVASHD